MGFEFGDNDIFSGTDLEREDEFLNIEVDGGVMQYNAYEDELNTVTENVMEHNDLTFNEVVSLVMQTVVKYPELLKGNFGYHKFLGSIKDRIMRDQGIEIKLSEFFTNNIQFNQFLRLLYSGAIVNNKIDKTIPNKYKVFLLLPGQEDDIFFKNIPGGSSLYKSYPALKLFDVKAFENIISGLLGDHKIKALGNDIIGTVLKAGKQPPKELQKEDYISSTPAMTNAELAEMVCSGDVSIDELKNQGIDNKRCEAIARIAKAISDESVG